MEEISIMAKNQLNILVSGGAGYIGSVAVRKFLSAGYNVRVYDNLTFHGDSIVECFENHNLSITIGDIRDEIKLQKAMQNIDVVVHLAGMPNDPCCDLNPAMSYSVMIDGTQKIVKAAKKAKVKRFIFGSSCSVYGAKGDTLLSEDTSEYAPVSLYAKSKLEGEKIVLSENDNNFSTTCLRLATVYGLSYNMRFDLVINTLVANAVTEKRITIYGGNQWRPLVNVKDVANAFLKVISAPLEKIKNDIYNVGSNEQNFRITDIGKIFQESFPDILVQHNEGALDTRSYRVNFDKIRNALDFLTQHNVRESIDEMKYAIINDYMGNVKSHDFNRVKGLLDKGGI